MGTWLGSLALNEIQWDLLGSVWLYWRYKGDMMEVYNQQYLSLPLFISNHPQTKFWFTVILGHRTGVYFYRRMGLLTQLCIFSTWFLFFIHLRMAPQEKCSSTQQSFAVGYSIQLGKWIVLYFKIYINSSIAISLLRPLQRKPPRYFLGLWCNQRTSWTGGPALQDQWPIQFPKCR